MHKLDIHKLADEARFNRFHCVVLLWCFLILVLDGYDLAVVGAALPSIMKDMGVNAAKAGFMASSALFGMMFGAIFLGTLADKVGRPKMMAICIAIFSVFTAAAGLTSDPVSFGITRFIAGLGIGGVMPIATAQMAEFSPVSMRARLVALVFAGYAVGGMLVAVVGKHLIETYGWQSVFYAAVLPVLLIPFILKTMPESMPFLIKKNRDADLRDIVRKLVPDYPLQEQEQFMVPVEDKADDAAIAHLFREGRGLSTVMIWIAFFCGLFMVYALSSWLTKLMAMAGYSLGSALNFVLVYNVGAIVGAMVGAWLGDKFNLKYALVALYALGAVSLTAMGYTKSTELLFLTAFLVGASTLGTLLVAYAYAAAFYPTAIRSTGVGFASGFGRTGAIAAPILIGGLVALKLPLEQNFTAIGLAGLLGMLAVLMVNHRLCASAHHRDATTETELLRGDTA